MAQTDGGSDGSRTESDDDDAGGTASSAEDWKLLSRRTDFRSKIDGHLEYARFLNFVRQNIVRNRRYRLALSDMSLLEIMPKGTYW